MSINSEENRHIDEATAITIARDTVRTQKFTDEQVMEAVREGYPGQPLFVNRIDVPNTFYYLVPWHALNGTYDLLIRIDAISRKYLGLVQFQKSHQPYFLDAREALQKAQTVAPLSNDADIRCVWRPCEQTTTPFSPLYEIATAEGAVLYIDMSGRIYDELTPLGEGGGTGK